MNKEKIEQKVREIAEFLNKPNGSNCLLPCHQAAMTMANWLLNNLWISVEDELPKDTSCKYFVAYKAMGATIFSAAYYNKDTNDWDVDDFGYGLNVTHWMSIPSLKGGESNGNSR